MWRRSRGELLSSRCARYRRWLLVSGQLEATGASKPTPLLRAHEEGECLLDCAGGRAAGIGQSGQRRSLAQHGPSGLRAVAGAASATWQRRAAQRGSERRVDVKVVLGQGAKCRPLRPHAGDARWKRRFKDTLGLTPEGVSGVPRAAWRCASVRLIARR